jgi:hypothetical protein
LNRLGSSKYFSQYALKLINSPLSTLVAHPQTVIDSEREAPKSSISHYQKLIEDTFSIAPLSLDFILDSDRSSFLTRVSVENDFVKANLWVFTKLDPNLYQSQASRLRRCEPDYNRDYSRDHNEREIVYPANVCECQGGRRVVRNAEQIECAGGNCDSLAAEMTGPNLSRKDKR